MNRSTALRTAVALASGLAVCTARNTAVAAPIQPSAPVVVNGVAYSLNFVSAQASSILDRIKATPWFNKTGNPTDVNAAIDLSIKFSEALNPPGTSVLYDKSINCEVSNSLSTPASRYGTFCPYFAYNIYPGPGGVGSEINIVASPFERNVYNAVNTIINYTASNVYGLFALADAATASAILPSGNAIGGSALNKTSNLSVSNLLLPSFQGGTLTVDTAAVNQNFSLSGSSSNSIDAAGLSATFSGVFADSDSATAGSISFQDSQGKQAAITLTSASTYTGITTVLSSGTLKLGGAGSISQSKAVLNNGLIDISGVDVSASLNTLAGRGNVDLGLKDLDLRVGVSQASAVFDGSISGDGNVTISGPGKQVFGGVYTYTGATTIKPGGNLSILGSTTSSTTVLNGGTLSGTGVIHGSVTNLGNVSPGGFGGSSSQQAIGQLTVDGDYGQIDPGTLRIDVDGSTSDLLQITGSGRVIILGGNLDIESVPGTSITAGIAYTAVDVPKGTQGGEADLKTKFGVVGSAGYEFVRETDPRFSSLRGGEQCKGIDDPDCTKLQFGWLQKQAVISKPPESGTIPPVVPVGLPPGTSTINQVKKDGGAITQAAAGDSKLNEKTCIRNSGATQACKSINAPGNGVTGSNPNNIAIAKALDGGSSSVQAAVQTGVTGGSPIRTPDGNNSGYTTNQAKAASITPDFVNVIGALSSLSTRQVLNRALHSLTAEPYASMQSVALEALEQFRTNTLALADSNKALRLFQEVEVCQLADGQVIAADDPKRPADCQPRKRSQASRWSLLIDATNTQANLDGTQGLASLDYNIFQSTYGLQYDASRQWSFGGAFGYGQANLYNFEYANSRIDSNTYGGSIWGIYRPSQPWRLTALLGYMNLQYDSSRQIEFGGLDRTARASWSGNGFTSALSAEYDWILNGRSGDPTAVRLRPRTYLAYSLHNQGDITESGAESLNLAIDGHTADSLMYGIGFTLETPIQLGRASRLIPRLTVDYAYDFNGDANEEHQLTAAFADVPALGSLDVLGQNRGANDLGIGLNLELETSEQFSLYGGVGGSFWSNGNEISYGGGLRWRF